jgi:integrase
MAAKQSPEKARRENEELVFQWLSHISIGLKAPTVDDYRRIGAAFLDFVGGESLIDLCNRAPARRTDLPPLVTTVRDFLFRDGRRVAKVKPSTVRKEKAALSSLFGWANAMQVTTHNPMPLVKAFLPPPPKGKPKPIDNKVWLQFWAAKMTLPERVCFALMFYCGLRADDVRQLEVATWDGERFAGWERKNGDEGTVDVYRQLLAFENAMPELIPEGADGVLAMVERLVEVRKGRRFVIPWGESDRIEEGSVNRLRYAVEDGCASTRQVYSRFTKIMKREGLYAPGISPHKLRHSCGTNMKRMGLEDSYVCEALGHRDLNMIHSYADIAGANFRDRVALLQRVSIPERPRTRR